MTETESSKFVSDVRRTDRRRITRDLFVGLGLSAGLIILYPLAGSTWLGSIANSIGFAIVQWRLPPDLHPPVVVLDISGVPTGPEHARQGNDHLPLTDRARLKAVLRAVIEQKPTAVGVDIDMSSYDGGYLGPGDPDFFKDITALARTNGVTVAFGVARRQAAVEREVARHPFVGQRVRWLGTGRYDGSAASIFLPTHETYLSFTRFVFGNTSLATLSAKLAHAHLESPAAIMADDVDAGRRWPQWFAQTATLGHEHHGTSAEWFLLNYSALQVIDSYRVVASEAAAVRSQGDRFRDHVVLVGDATANKTSDTFPLPSLYVTGAKDLYPGVLFHAVATYTLIQPLYRLTGAARALSDFLFAAVVLGAVFFIRIHYSRKAGIRVAAHRLQLIGFGLAVVVVCVGVFLVPYTRLVWEDWMLAVIVLWLHPRIETWIEWIRTAWLRYYQPVRDAVVLENEGGVH